MFFFFTLAPISALLCIFFSGYSGASRRQPWVQQHNELISIQIGQLPCDLECPSPVFLSREEKALLKSRYDPPNSVILIFVPLYNSSCEHNVNRPPTLVKQLAKMEISRVDLTNIVEQMPPIVGDLGSGRSGLDGWRRGGGVQLLHCPVISDL